MLRPRQARRSLDPSADLDFRLPRHPDPLRPLPHRRQDPTVHAASRPRSSSGCAWPWALPWRNEETNRESWVIRLYNLYKAAASAPPPRPSSTPARSTASSPPATSTRWTTPSSRSCTAASPKTPSSPSGPAASAALDRRARHRRLHRGTNGESQGVIPFLKLHNDQLVAVNQGGKRRGSGCAYLETWHNDISTSSNCAATPATTAAAATT
jgi:hypothetical protein